MLSQEVPYIGGVGEMKFYVEGLRFPAKDFNGLISINLSLLEPISDVRPSYVISKNVFLLLYRIRLTLYVNLVT